MVKQKKVYRWYLILSIIYSLISILTGIILFKPELIPFISSLWSPIVFLWFIFNIVMLVIFIKDKVEKIALWLPSLYIFDQIFSIIVGVISGIIGIMNGLTFIQILQSPFVVIASELFPVITLILAIRLFVRKK
jgi:hypothetical protein